MVSETGGVGSSMRIFGRRVANEPASLQPYFWSTSAVNRRGIFLTATTATAGK